MFKIQCWWIIGPRQTASQCSPNFSYVEVGEAVDFDSLKKRGENLG